MKRQLLMLLCATTLAHAMQTPLLKEGTSLTAPHAQDNMQLVDLEKGPIDDLNATARIYQRLLNDKSYAERTLADWKLKQGDGYFKDVHPPVLLAGGVVGAFAALSASASIYNWKEASEEATGKNITTGIASAGATAVSAPCSYLAIRVGWNYTRFIETRVDAATQALTAFTDKYPNITEQS